MSDRTHELARRRAALQERCAAQRAQLGVISGELQYNLRFIDRGIELARRLTSAPVLILIGLAALALVGPAGMVRWTSRAALLAAAVRRLTLAGSEERPSH